MYLSVFDESNVIMCILLLNNFATKLQNVKTNLSQYAFIIREKDIFWPPEKIYLHEFLNHSVYFKTLIQIIKAKVRFVRNIKLIISFLICVKD